MKPLAPQTGQGAPLRQIKAIGFLETRQRLPAVALAMMMDGAARVIDTDREFGAFTGHAETIRFIERLLDRIEPAAPQPPKR